MATKTYIIRVNIDKFKKCDDVYCEMYDNCRKTYKECRYYKKDFWRKLDKEFDEIRKDVFRRITRGVK